MGVSGLALAFLQKGGSDERRIVLRLLDERGMSSPVRRLWFASVRISKGVSHGEVVEPAKSAGTR